MQPMSNNKALLCQTTCFTGAAIEAVVVEACMTSEVRCDVHMGPASFECVRMVCWQHFTTTYCNHSSFAYVDTIITYPCPLLAPLFTVLGVRMLGKIQCLCLASQPKTAPEARMTPSPHDTICGKVAKSVHVMPKYALTRPIAADDLSFHHPFLNHQAVANRCLF